MITWHHAREDLSIHKGVWPPITGPTGLLRRTTTRVFIMSKVAIITGASSGIGRATAFSLSRDGWSIVLFARRLEKLQETQKMCEDPFKCFIVQGDVSSEEDVLRLFRETVEHFGRLDLLFNNAGVLPPELPIEDLPLSAFQNVVNINLTGVFLCTREAIKVFKSQSPQGGRIINNGSISAYTPRPHLSPYAATKHAVLGMTKSTSLEGRKYNIACTQVDIGNASSEMANGLHSAAVQQADGRLVQEPMIEAKYVADTITHIASLPLEVTVLTFNIMPTSIPMTSLIPLVQRGLRPTHVFRAARPACRTRVIHQTSVALKKHQKGAASEDDDLFGVAPEEDSLFGAGPASESTSSIDVTPTPTPSSSTGKDSVVRLNQYNELVQRLKDHTGSKPPPGGEQIPTSIWHHLFDLATTAEQLEQVADSFPRWRDKRRVFRPATAERFARRCEELHCPQLALKVFSDHSKYGLDLTLPAARRLLHALHQEHPLQDCIMLAALYRVYNLPPVSSDLVSCTLLVVACYTHPSPHARVVADEMVPHLRQLLESSKGPYTLKMTNGAPAEKEEKWMLRALYNVKAQLQKTGHEYRWLDKWMGNNLQAS
ncbi:Glucose 1-dehydrogenase 3 [Grifola frondosa]|uniref:Glucose 1-dehydrogenase 3 n=1 Tax=Grifola frondosa TaxID=5627 RepID=A0A1C7M3V4_GRIFR|nr:Glucose 1-dehydrogenase 3 [Grifola frondosa]